MDRVEIRTMLRTIFSKLKAFYRYRQHKYRLKLRVNVHIKLKLSRKTFLALDLFKKLNKLLIEKNRKAARFCTNKLKDKSLAGFIRNSINLEEKRKRNFKALCFFKHSYMYRSFLRWKNLESWIQSWKYKKLIADQHYNSFIKKKFIKTIKIGTRILADNRVLKENLDKKIKQVILKRFAFRINLLKVFKRQEQLIMLRAVYTEKKLMKQKWIKALKKNWIAKQEKRRKFKIASKKYESNLKKTAFELLLFKDGIKQHEQFLEKKVFMSFSVRKMRKREKQQYYLGFCENYFYRLSKTTFWKWKVFRVKCIRRRNQIKRAQNYYFSNNLHRCLSRWREIYKFHARQKKAITCLAFTSNLKQKQIFFNLWSTIYKAHKRFESASNHHNTKTNQKFFNNLKNFIKYQKKQKLLFRKSEKIYRASLKRKLFCILKAQPRTRVNNRKNNEKAFQHLRLKTIKTYFKLFQTFIHKKIKLIQNQKLIKVKSLKASLKTHYNGWVGLYKRHVYETELSQEVIKARVVKIKKYLLNEWTRAFVAHSRKRVQSAKKVENFKSKQIFKCLVKCIKSWVRLFRSGDHYRKLKKLSRKVFEIKITKKYFVGFLIINEKRRIKDMKIFKAVCAYNKSLKERVFKMMAKGCRRMLIYKLESLQAIKFWSIQLYQKVFSCMKEYWIMKIEKRKKLRQSSEMRAVDLAKSGIRIFLQYGLKAKAIREEKIRKAIILQNLKRTNNAKKYAKIWINKIKSKRLLNFQKERVPLYSIV